MINLTYLFRWQIWSTLLCLISSLIGGIRLSLLLGRAEVTPVDQDVEKWGDSSISSDDSRCFIFKEHYTAITQASNRKLLKIGIFAEVYLLDGVIIRKVPRSKNDEDMLPILREATVTDFVDIKYYPSGDLAAFILNKKENLTLDLQKKWFGRLQTGCVFGRLQLISVPGYMVLGFKKASYYLSKDYEAPNSVMSELFALGSILYELVAYKTPHSHLCHVESEDVVHSSNQFVIQAWIQREQQVDLEIEACYRNQKISDVTCFFGSEIIFGCWKGSFLSAREALRQYVALVGDA
ncbi:hypothetical protein BDW59DRAFT_176437 [Aspergillus cavernicola]|uniref:Protein kinase domain-containing protein n=1 Tax=Aspergillus cavernicola TaxID=176166 RepID=A0ABR4HGA0_9EURO